MAAQNRLLSLFFLFALLTTGFARSLAEFTVQEDLKETNDVKETAKINDLFDLLLPAVKKFILKYGLDPLKLDDISEKLPGIINHSRVINLSNGWFQGLSNLKRATDIILSYENKVLTVDAYLTFDIVGFNYEYAFKDLLFTRKGEILGNLKDMKMRVIVGVDFANYKLFFDKAKIIEIGTLDIKLEGHKLDPILNAAIKALTNIFHKKVVAMVEKEVAVILQSLLDKANDKIPRPDTQMILNNGATNVDDIIPLLFRLM